MTMKIRAYTEYEHNGAWTCKSFWIVGQFETTAKAFLATKEKGYDVLYITDENGKHLKF